MALLVARGLLGERGFEGGREVDARLVGEADQYPQHVGHLVGQRALLARLERLVAVAAGHYALQQRLRVAVARDDGLDHLARPEDVVGDEHRARSDQRPAVAVSHQHAVVVGVFALVAVDEHEVEPPAQRGGDVERRADVEADLRAVGRAVEVGLRELLELVVALDGVQLGAVVQPRGHREGRVAGEGADLEHAPRAVHPHQHLEQLALEVAREHARCHGAAVGFSVELLQELLLGLGVVVDVSFECFHRLCLVKSLLVEAVRRLDCFGRVGAEGEKAGARELECG